MFDPLPLAWRLIDIPSPTEQEAAVGTFLHDELARLGYDCRKQEVTAERFNVFAGAGGRPRVVREGVPNLDSVKRSVEGLRQLRQRIRKRSRGRSALSPAEVRAAIGHGRK